MVNVGQVLRKISLWSRYSRVPKVQHLAKKVHHFDCATWHKGKNRRSNVSKEGLTFHCATAKIGRGARSTPRPTCAAPQPNIEPSWDVLSIPFLFALVPRGTVSMFDCIGQMLHLFVQMFNLWHPGVSFAFRELQMQLCFAAMVNVW